MLDVLKIGSLYRGQGVHVSYTLLHLSAGGEGMGGVGGWVVGGGRGGLVGGGRKGWWMSRWGREGWVGGQVEEKEVDGRVGEGGVGEWAGGRGRGG